ncbi:thioesterase family protein [Sorangium sp. So ce887]|uniref:thioesterase family protein n=1 Tax=Sorangium sp. So ce887 TaxID=3133324 RepID=UPI003F606886
MNTMTLPSDLEFQERISVRVEDCASSWGNDGLLAFSTPAMLGYMELACVKALRPHLPAGTMTVGGTVTLQHLAPTPAGTHVELRVALREIDGKRLRFAFTVHDAQEKVGEGIHDRYLVNQGRFEERLQQKRAALGVGPQAVE